MAKTFDKLTSRNAGALDALFNTKNDISKENDKPLEVRKPSPEEKEVINKNQVEEKIDEQERGKGKKVLITIPWDIYDKMEEKRERLGSPITFQVLEVLTKNFKT